jgi:hypothetical protein
MDFKDRVASAGGAVILAGSGSDAEHIKTLETELEKAHIAFQTRICSAHKQPRKLLALVEDADALLKNPGQFTGRASEQVDDYLASHVRPVLDRYKDLIGKSDGKVRV